MLSWISGSVCIGGRLRLTCIVIILNPLECSEVPERTIQCSKAVNKILRGIRRLLSNVFGAELSVLSIAIYEEIRCTLDHICAVDLTELG